MRKVVSAPCLLELGAQAAAPQRPLAASLGGAEGRGMGDAGGVGQMAGARKTSLSPLPGNSMLMPHAPQSATRPSVRTCAAAVPPVALPDVTPVVREISMDLEGMAKSVEEEVVVESGLHVVGIAAGGCVQHFGVASKLAPALVDAGAIGNTSEEDLGMAMCMATPFEGEGGGLDEEVQRSLDDLALQNEIRFELEYALDSLAHMSLSDSEDRNQLRLRTNRNRRRRRPIRFGGVMTRGTRSAADSTSAAKENCDVQGNIVSTGGLHGLLKQAVAPQQSE
ncbi:unnamed protein product [Ostreobium quekettii]|uniref:Uncharacterized protein n=1 Tax=Ostreobium quekettii TaxID=121088 RepID=A0A8S1IZV7_9CHLO|nr:unnamed protein product [Ostreobium quekettii]